MAKKSSRKAHANGSVPRTSARIRCVSCNWAETRTRSAIDEASVKARQGGSSTARVNALRRKPPSSPLLFRTHKVNPMGGCFPLLIQMPVFFALYRVLYNAIELRHAPFVFWLQDLSAKDPFFITPVLLGVAMYLQQKMTPTPATDSSQEMMMKMSGDMGH